MPPNPRKGATRATNRDTRDLLRDARAGDTAAREELAGRWIDEAYLLARGKLGHGAPEEDVEDIALDAATAALRKATDGPEPRNPDALRGHTVLGKISDRRRTSAFRKLVHRVIDVFRPEEIHLHGPPPPRTAPDPVKPVRVPAPGNPILNAGAQDKVSLKAHLSVHFSSE